LIVNGRSYLIDCGIGTVRRLVKAGVPSETIKTIFFSHLHPDHALGLADVMANDYEHSRVGLMAGESAVFDVYGPPHTAEFVDAAFRYVSIPYRMFAAEQLAPTQPANPFHVHEIPQQGLVFQNDRIRVTAAENSHYTLMSAESRQVMKSYAFRIETPNGAVVFTGDTGPSDAVAPLAKGADVLVAESTIENYAEEVASLKRRAEQNHWDPQHTQTMAAHFTASHLDLEHVAQLVSKTQVNAVLLYHGRPSDASAYVAKVKEGDVSRVLWKLKMA
jgi:ribonuclease BN (tRNA processing enzyme)